MSSVLSPLLLLSLSYKHGVCLSGTRATHYPSYGSIDTLTKGVDAAHIVQVRDIAGAKVVLTKQGIPLRDKFADCT